METSLEGFTLLLEEAKATDAVRLRDLLEAAGIPSKVKRADELAAARPADESGLPLRNVYVPRNLAARAKAVLERVRE